MEGVVAAVLLIIGGEQVLNILQTAVVMIGLPFALIIVFSTFLLIKELIFSRQK